MNRVFTRRHLLFRGLASTISAHNILVGCNANDEIATKSINGSQTRVFEPPKPTISQATQTPTKSASTKVAISKKATPPTAQAVNFEFATNWPESVTRMLEPILRENLVNQGFLPSAAQIIRPTPRPKLYVTSIRDNPPDLISVPDPVAWGQRGLLEKMQTSEISNYYNDVHANLLSSVNPYKAICSIPIGLSVKGFVYRDDMLQENGFENPPANRGELLDMAKTLTLYEGSQVQRAGMALPFSPTTAQWLIFAWQSGARIITDDRSGANLTSDECIEGATLFRSFFQDPGMTFRRELALQNIPSSLLMSGHAAMEYTDYHRLLTHHSTSDVTAKLATAPAPGHITKIVPGSGRVSVGIPKGAKSDHSIALLNTILSRPIVSMISNYSNIPPARISLQKEIEQTNRNYKAYFSAQNELRDRQQWPSPKMRSAVERATKPLALSKSPIISILNATTSQT